MAEVKRNISFEDAHLMFRNFAGNEGRFNAPGKRNFCVRLDKDVAEELNEEGWPIKVLTPKNEDDEPIPYMQVNVKFGQNPPKIYLVTKRNKTLLTEEVLSTLDFAEIETADLVIRPYNWEVNGNKGVKPYLKAAYITIREDDFAEKYSDVPDSAFAYSNTDGYEE